MPRTIATGPDIEVSADFAQASSQLTFRAIGDEEWQPTPYQVADAAHDPERALRLVSDWADAQAA